jgi:hypothetical protein
MGHRKIPGETWYQPEIQEALARCCKRPGQFGRPTKRRRSTTPTRFVKRLLAIFVMIIAMTGCVSDDQTYLVACPREYISTEYPIVSTKRGWVERTGSLDLLYRGNKVPVAVLNGCEWVMVDESIESAPHYIIQMYGEDMWAAKKALDGLPERIFQ